MVTSSAGGVLDANKSFPGWTGGFVKRGLISNIPANTAPKIPNISFCFFITQNETRERFVHRQELKKRLAIATKVWIVLNRFEMTID